MKPYQLIPIQDCGELLQEIPADLFSLESPPPYQKLGANYGDRSPFYLRESVLNALINAQLNLTAETEGKLRLKVFDAYRPIAVQQFMVDHTFQILSNQYQNSKTNAEIWQDVYQFWAMPSDNPDMPPPHSTGAAIDLTLVDSTGQALDMGGAIDEISPQSFPDYYAHHEDELGQNYHAHRLILRETMQEVGFVQHPNEWWHFSLGDQLWAWRRSQLDKNFPAIARYGRI